MTNLGTMHSGRSRQAYNQCVIPLAWSLRLFANIPIWFLRRHVDKVWSLSWTNGPSGGMTAAWAVRASTRAGIEQRSSPRAHGSAVAAGQGGSCAVRLCGHGRDLAFKILHAGCSALCKQLLSQPPPAHSPVAAAYTLLQDIMQNVSISQLERRVKL